MFQITVDNRQATVEERELLTSGSRGIEVQFNLSAEWDGLIKTAVFRDDDDESTQIDVVITDTLSCVIPWETLEEPERGLFAGIYGTDTEGNVVIPTVWVSLGAVKPGVKPGNASGADPTPSQWAQIQGLAVSAEESAATAEAYAEHQPVIGEDGYWYTWNGSAYVTTGQKAQGEKGNKGDTGIGVPAGGTTGQVLKKKSGTDYDTEWANESGGGTSDYTDLTNKPQINGNTLTGNKTGADLGLVNAVTGKQLSTEDYTTAEKTKLSGIEAQANKTVIDDTLTNTGEAADAKAAGDAVSAVRNTLNQLDGRVDSTQSTEAYVLGSATAGVSISGSGVYVIYNDALYTTTQSIASTDTAPYTGKISSVPAGGGLNSLKQDLFFRGGDSWCPDRLACPFMIETTTEIRIVISPPKIMLRDTFSSISYSPSAVEVYIEGTNIVINASSITDVGMSWLTPNQMRCRLSGNFPTAITSNVKHVGMAIFSGGNTISFN